MTKDLWAVARPWFCLPPLFREGIQMLNSLDCKIRAAECEKLAEGTSNPRVQVILRDMARTWTRLALEAEQTMKQTRPPLQLIVPSPLLPRVSPQAPPGS